MSIELVTGLPGAGKSLSAVDRMLTLRDRDGSRPVYALGVSGLRKGVALPLTPEDLTRWYEFPPGSIFVVDEAQKYFPMRRAGDPPAWVRKLSEHRHLGVDFILMTQAPGFIDTYVRSLVDRHVHLVRKFGAAFCDRYEWPVCCMSPLSPGERKRAIKTAWRYPKRCYEFYESAELHTVKRRIPAKLYLLVACAVVVVAAVFAVPWVMHRFGSAAQKLSPSAIVPPASFSRALSVAPASSGYSTPADYVKAFLPRVAAQPWSAPVYDDRKPQAKPDLYCVSYHRVIAGLDQELCGCFTEQLTPYRVGSSELCRTYARDGVYNPFRTPISDREGSREPSGPGSSSAPASSARASAASPAGLDWPEQRSAMHAPYVPPGLSHAPQSVGAAGGGVGASPPR